MTNRRSFLIGAGAGLGAGVLGTHFGGHAVRHALDTENRPPWAVEHASGSFWMDSAGYFTAPPRPPLTARSHETDILIIGGGYTGMSTAWHLTQTRPEARITLIDAARCGFGASGRNGGWCMGLNHNATSSAPDLVAASKDFMGVGVDIVRDLTETHGIDCDFTPAHQISAVRSEEDAGGLDFHIEAMDGIGVPTERFDRAGISDRLTSEHFAAGAIYHDGSANIHAGKLADGMRSLLLTTPVEIFEGTKVVSLTGGTRPRVETEYGTITADQVVLTTNAYTRSYGEFRGRYLPIISSVIATEPLSDAQLASIGLTQGQQFSIGDSGSSYFYTIMTADNRILMGGAHAIHHYGSGLHSGNVRIETNFLEDYLTGEIWPQLKGLSVTHRWGGAVCITSDMLFSVGRHPNHENVVYALGYSGEGVSTSFAAGKALAEMLADLDTPLTRSPFIDRPLSYIPGEPLRSLTVRMLR